MNFDFSKISAESTYEPVEEIAAAVASGKCGDCFACCMGYHEQCKGKEYDWSSDPDYQIDDER